MNDDKEANFAKKLIKSMSEEDLKKIMANYSEQEQKKYMEYIKKIRESD